MRDLIMLQTARVLVPCLLLLVGACSERSPASLAESARKSLEQNKPAAAMIDLRAALEKDPRLAEARFLLGRTLLLGSDAVGAEVELRKALELGKPASDVLPALALALLRQGQFERLTEEFGASVPMTPSALADVKAGLATAFMALGRPDDAKAALQEALAAEPDHPGAQVVQVRLLAGQGDNAAAMALSAKLLERHPSHGDAWKVRGDLLTRIAQDRDGALAAYRKAVELDPLNLEAHVDAIGILLQGNDAAEQRRQIEKFRAVAPGHPLAQYFEARLAFGGKDYASARAALQQVLRRLPDDGPALELAGATELVLGSLVSAEAHLARALQKAPHKRAIRRMLAEVQMRRGRTSEALMTLLPAMAPIPDAATLTVAARANLQAGNTREAETLFKRAAAMDPKSVESRAALASAGSGKQAADASLKELEALSAADSGSAADLAIFSARLARGEYEAALAALDQIEKKAPDQAYVANLRGRAQMLMKDGAGARASFERSVAIDPHYFPAHASLVALAVADNQLDEARKRLEGIVRAEPKNAQAWSALAELSKRSRAPRDEVTQLLRKAVEADPADVGVRLRLIDHHLRARDARAALTAAQVAASTLPDEPRIQEALGRAQLAMGDHEQALGTFERLRVRHPMAPGIPYRLAEAYFAAGRPDQARRSLQQALTIAPHYLEAQEQLVRLEAGNRRYGDALAIARQVQKQRPKEGIGYLLEGDIEAMRGRPAAALVTYRQALRVAPATVAAERVHAALLVMKQSAEAQAFEEAWIKEHPNDARFRQYLGDKALLRGDLAQAETRYREVLNITPDNPLALNNVALVLLRQSKSGALAMAEKAFRLSPDTAAIADTLALALAAEGSIERAIQVQTKVVAANPREPLFRLNLARLYIQASRKTEARGELATLAELGDKFGGQAEVSRLLSLLK